MNSLKKPIKWTVFMALVLLILTASPLLANESGSAKVIKVVAAENFYGDIVKQLGGKQVDVTSILSDPNVDPHEYESNISDAKAIAGADLVIENSGGYDSWMDKVAVRHPRTVNEFF